MMKHFIFPEPVSDTQVEEAVKELFVKYGYYADRQTLGEAPEMPENIKKALKPTEISREVVTTTEELKAIISSL